MLHMGTHVDLIAQEKRSESSRRGDGSPSELKSIMKRTEHPSSAEEALRLVAKFLKKGTKHGKKQQPGCCPTCGYRHLSECKWLLRADGILELKNPDDRPPNYEAMVRDGPARPKVSMARGKRQESLNFQGQPRPGQRRF
jgi:predicted Zn-ribbon and HTH transcriptional regulator